MKIIVTGISNSGRKEFMAEFENLCREKKADISFFDIGNVMKQTARESGINFTDLKVLDSDATVLSLARRTAFYKISLEAQKTQHSMVGIHACFRWRGVLMEGMSYREVLEFPADIFLNVVDNIQDVIERFKNNPQWSWMKSDEVGVWMDEEEFLTEQLANISGKPFYTVALEQPVADVYDLVFGHKKKFYLSYPITVLEETSEEVERIRGLVNRLRENFICFDPMYIKDMGLARELERADKETSITDIDSRMIDQIKTRTVDRDYQFIHQSDFVVVMYPTDKISPGVLSEMNFAYRYNKPVYAYFPHVRSPFFEALCERIFTSVQELEDFLISSNGVES
ncbi:MAG: hypothetical protein IT209_02045 [Armatimonadetes bacterium]|nr:hypothetical protein [Armatimonadota bacterium]